MPYILSPIISENSLGMWAEGTAYEKKSIYSIDSGKLPPVNYDEHVIRSHSLTHFETPAHTQKDGLRLGHFYNRSLSIFYGKAVLIVLDGNNYKDIGNGIFHWIISKEELKDKIESLKVTTVDKVLITTKFYPENEDGFHDPNYVLTLSQEAADFLISFETFHLYGTSWKSSDYNPGKVERPIHNTIFKKGLILENLKLKEVPEGIYFMTAFPLPFKNASESPVVPVLFTEKEITNFF